MYAWLVEIFASFKLSVARFVFDPGAVVSIGMRSIARAVIVHQQWQISAFATSHQSPPLALQPWVVFDPGGMIFLLTWLLLHTIHNLEAKGAVFDPRKSDVLKLVNAASS